MSMQWDGRRSGLMWDNMVVSINLNIIHERLSSASFYRTIKSPKFGERDPLCAGQLPS